MSVELAKTFYNSYCSDFKKRFPDALNKQAPKKIKIYRGNQKPNINKTLLQKDRNSKTKQTKLETQQTF